MVGRQRTTALNQLHMHPNILATSNDAPIAVGGVGGSGTRLVAALLRELGVWIGGDLNQANDALWFTLLFKRQEILTCRDSEFDELTQMLLAGLRGGRPLGRSALDCLDALSKQDRRQHPSSWLATRAQTLIAAASRAAITCQWGWKEPNTHMVIERLWKRLPDLRYVHVVRHGLDMAYSQNQNQLKFWGREFLGSDGPATPARSLAYWCDVHQRVQAQQAQRPDRVYWLDYDALCRNPLATIDGLRGFLKIDAAINQEFLNTVVPQAPRHAVHSLENMATADIEYVRSLGYAIHTESSGHRLH